MFLSAENYFFYEQNKIVKNNNIGEQLELFFFGWQDFLPLQKRIRFILHFLEFSSTLIRIIQFILRGKFLLCQIWYHLLKFSSLPVVKDVIYQTRGRVFHPISKHREVVEKTRRSRVFFNQLQGVWISDETPFRMFDIASQTINNSWRKSKQKFTRFYDN